MSLDTFEPVFGEWKLGRQLGSGADGKVYRLVPLSPTHEKSVIKIIKLDGERIASTNTDDKNFLSYSKQEYCKAFVKNITDNISIVQSTDAGKFFVDYRQWEVRPSSDGVSSMLLIRMEQLTPLSDFIGEFAFTEPEILRLAICLCQSLDECRDFGFVYPNLKPENILFDVRGRCKLGDFGTFCCTGPQRNSIAYKRTQQYMAPEFYFDGSINETCDTYSLGLILYSLLNKGRLPFLKPYPANITMNDSSDALRRRVKGEDVPPPAMASEETSEVILKAISFNPSERYMTPRHMLNDLKMLLDGEPIPTVSEPVTETTNHHQPEEPPPETAEELFSRYEQAYSDARVSRTIDSDLTENKRLQQKPDLSNVVTYNYKDKSSEYIGKIPKRFFVIIVAAVTVLILAIIALGIKYGIDGVDNAYIQNSSLFRAVDIYYAGIDGLINQIISIST